MSNIKRPFGISDALDLSSKNIAENTIDLTLDVKDLLNAYQSNVNDRKSLETVMKKLNSDLQKEESISTMLFAMKSSQSKSFSNLSKINLTNKSRDQVNDSKVAKRKAELTDDGSKNDEYHLTMEMSRKILDHQFITRQKMINNQLEKALYEMPLKNLQPQNSNEFIPTTTNQEFIALVGFNEVVDVLKKEQQPENENDMEINSSIDKVSMCDQCGTDSSPVWKKQKIDSESQQTMCTLCNDKILQTQIRKDLDERIQKMKLQFDEQEKNLIRDYNDMLSSPKKMEMFRQEQEKRQRLQKLSNGSSTKPNRPSLINTLPNNKPNTPIMQKPHYDGKNAGTSTGNNAQSGQCTKLSQRSVPVKELTRTPSTINTPNVNQLNGGDSTNTPTSSQLTYLQFLQAFIRQANNSQHHIDQDNLQKLEQILAMVSTNPVLANNNSTVLQLISKLTNQPKASSMNNVNNSVNNSSTASINSNLMNLLSYFVNLMQTQQSQNTV